MKKLHKLYENLSDIEKKTIINSLYITEKKSFADIATIYGTYSNRIRRDAKKLQINIRDKSEAQKNALTTGKHSHPTKGKTRSSETKEKIGLSVLQSWENLSDEEIEKRKQSSKANWDNLSVEAKEHMQKSANAAIRISSKIGSKLEKFLYIKLINDGFKVEFHKENTLANTKLQIDMFIPSINTAIEIDGPSHFEPVWGQDALSKNITYDQKKEGLIFGRGWSLIRIKQTKDFSKARSNLIYSKLAECISINSKILKSGQQKMEIHD